MDKIILATMTQNYEVSSDSTSVSYIDMEVPLLEKAGPYLEAISAHTDTRNRTTNLQWKVVFWKSFEGKNWEGPYDLFSVVTANGYVIQLPYTTTQNFGLRLKFALAISNVSGSLLERAILGCVLVGIRKS